MKNSPEDQPTVENKDERKTAVKDEKPAVGVIIASKHVINDNLHSVHHAVTTESDATKRMQMPDVAKLHTGTEDDMACQSTQTSMTSISNATKDSDLASGCSQLKHNHSQAKEQRSVKINKDDADIQAISKDKEKSIDLHPEKNADNKGCAENESDLNLPAVQANKDDNKSVSPNFTLSEKCIFNLVINIYI